MGPSPVCVLTPQLFPTVPEGHVWLLEGTAPLRAHLKRPSQKLKHQCVSAFSIPHLSVFLSYCLFAQTSRAVVHSSLSYNRESGDDKSPTTGKPQSLFLHSSTILLSSGYLQPAKAWKSPLGGPLNNSLPEWILLNLYSNQ